MPRYDVFLSHASADKPAAEHLARKLRDEGLEPFLDKWHLIPGEPWQEALEEALDQSRTCAVFIGKELGPWQNKEMRSALETQVQNRSFRLIPVLLPGGRKPGEENLPRFLRGLTWVDFRAGLDDEDAFRRLLAGIRGKAPGPGGGGGGGGGEKPPLPYRCMAPAREPFVQRSEYVKVRDALLLDVAEGPGRATTVGITTAIYGAGGFGKTALAIELCYDEQVREKYPDGILWTTMGEEIDAAGRLARVRDLIRWWTEEDPPAFETVSAASAYLRQELDGKQVLLVVDDVWRPEDVTPLQGLGPRAAFLVTTRDSWTLPVDSVPVHVDAMEVPEAVRLLESGFPNGSGVDLRGLAKRLGEWPLLLKIVNRQLRELIQQDGLSLELAFGEVNEALDAEGLTAFDREDLESRDQAVARTLGASLQRLSQEEVERFELLAIFLEDNDIPLPTLEKLWGLGSFATRKLCGRLYELSLFLRFDRTEGTIRLHDVIRACLLKNGARHLSDWHWRFLGAVIPESSCWPDLPHEEGYLWNHLFHHLMGAGRVDVCQNLLVDYRYLSSKLKVTDINSLLADYLFFVEKDEELRFVRDALRLSAHVLAKNPNQLREQLWGRLNREAPRIRGLLDQANDRCHDLWLRPKIPSLFQPDGALLRTIEDPGGFPSALAALSDGRVISASFDGKIRLWDMEGGQIIQLIEGHDKPAYALAVLDHGRVISGSTDGTLLVWSLENGNALFALEGHSDWIGAVAVLDSQRVVSASEDKTLRVWNVDSRRELRILEGHSGKVHSVAILDKRRVVSGSADGTLRIWDVDSGQILRILEGPAKVLAVAVLDDKRVVSGSVDGMLRVWDINEGRIVAGGYCGYAITEVAVLGRQRVITGDSVAGILQVWDIANSEVLSDLEGHDSRINGVVVLSGQRVVSGSFDGTLRVWDASRGSTPTRNSRRGAVRALEVFQNHRVVSCSLDERMRVWDITSGQAVATLRGHSSYVNAIAALDSQKVISSSNDGTLRIWNVIEGQMLKALDASTALNDALAVLPDSRRIVSCSYEALLVWDVETGQPLLTLRERSSPKTVVALDSKRVVSGSFDGWLCLWDVERGEKLDVVQGTLIR